MGRMIIRSLLSVSEMERNMIVECTQAGKVFAKQHNPKYKDGRAKKYSRTTAIFDYSSTHTVKNTVTAFSIY